MAKTAFTCATCRRRIEIGAPVGDDAPLLLDPATLVNGSGWRTLESFAREFDRLTGEAHAPYSALDFVSWLRPSVKGSERQRVSQSITSLTPWRAS